MSEEKIYCCERPNNDLALAALMGGKQHSDPLAMAAMMNGGMGGNWMNNPFAYIMFMMLFRQMGGFGGPGMGEGGAQGQQNIEVQNQLEAIRTQLGTTQNSNLVMEAIQGNAAAISQLASNLNCNFNAVNSAVCDVRAGIDKLAGQMGFSAERVINAVNLGDSSIVSKLQECCCGTKTAILEMGYQNQLANCQQTGTITGAITNLGNMMQQGFSSVGYATQQQTCEILQGQQASTQRIIDTLNCHWNQDLQQRYNDARLELSQLKQNETLIAALKTTTTTA
jgi:hypothetical protein